MIFKVKIICDISFFCLDITLPKGTVLVECGRMLKKGIPLLDDNGAVVKDDKGKTVYQPYKIKVLNTINFARSMHYNPFAYARHEVA